MNIVCSPRLQGELRRIRSCLVALLTALSLLFPAAVHALPTQLGDLDEDGQLTALDLVRLINHLKAEAMIAIYIRAQPFTDLGTTNQLNGGQLIIP